MRFELTRANAHYPLKVACLPFHHGIVTSSIILYAEMNFQYNLHKFCLSDKKKSLRLKACFAYGAEEGI